MSDLICSFAYVCVYECVNDTEAIRNEEKTTATISSEIFVSLCSSIECLNFYLSLISGRCV